MPGMVPASSGSTMLSTCVIWPRYCRISNKLDIIIFICEGDQVESLDSDLEHIYEIARYPFEQSFIPALPLVDFRKFSMSNQKC